MFFRRSTPSPQLMVVRPDSKEIAGFYIENLSGGPNYCSDDIDGCLYPQEVFIGLDDDGHPMSFPYDHLDYLQDHYTHKFIVHIPSSQLEEFLSDVKLLKLPYIVEYSTVEAFHGFLKTV